MLYVTKTHKICMYVEYKKLIYPYRVLLTSPISIHPYNAYNSITYNYTGYQILYVPDTCVDTHLNLRNVVLQFVYPLLVLSSIIIVYTTNPYIAIHTYI